MEETSCDHNLPEVSQLAVPWVQIRKSYIWGRGQGRGWSGVAEGKAAGVVGGYKEEILTVSWV